MIWNCDCYRVEGKVDVVQNTSRFVIHLKFMCSEIEVQLPHLQFFPVIFMLWAMH